MPGVQIVAMGGGGFSMEPENPLLDDYLLGLTGATRPRICFVPTASGDSDSYIERFYAAFPEERALATHLPLFRRDRRDPRLALLEQDVIYVGGGNTANLLAVWRVHGVDLALREAAARGVILAGVSAGMICWFEAGHTDSFGGVAPLNDGLGLLAGSACPHYDGEVDRRPDYRQRVASGELPPGVAADDGAALHFVDGALAAAVSSRPGAGAWRVEPGPEGAVETPLPVRYLGASAGG
jgi:dipeptidase E